MLSKVKPRLFELGGVKISHLSVRQKSCFCIIPAPDPSRLEKLILTYVV